MHVVGLLTARPCTSIAFARSLPTPRRTRVRNEQDTALSPQIRRKVAPGNSNAAWPQGYCSEAGYGSGEPSAEHGWEVMSGHSKMKTQRLKLAYRQKWRCFFCGRQMTSPANPQRGVSPAPTSLTFEHYDSRLDADRGHHAGEFRNVASCWECNHKRNEERQKLVSLEELRARSKRHC